MGKIIELKYGEYTIRYPDVVTVIKGITEGNECLIFSYNNEEDDIVGKLVYYAEDKSIEVISYNYTIDEKVIELDFE